MEEESVCKVYIDNLIDRIEKIKPLGGKCPLCESKLTEKHKEKIIKESKEEIGKVEKELKKAKQETRKIEKLIETIEKKNLRKPKCFIWHICGAFDWTLGRRGLFSISIHESGDILGATMAAHNVREYESLPIPW